MGLAEHVMAIILAAAVGGMPAGQGLQSGGAGQDVDASLLADLELIRMLDLLRDFDAIRQMDEVMGPARGERKSGQGGQGKAR